jgi:hypothetical protein
VSVHDYRAWLNTWAGRTRTHLGIEQRERELADSPAHQDAIDNRLDAKEREFRRAYGRGFTDAEAASVRLLLESESRTFLAAPGTLGLQDYRDMGWAFEVPAEQYAGAPLPPGLGGNGDGPFVVRQPDGSYSGGDAETRARAEAADAARMAEWRSGDAEWARRLRGIA